MYTDIFHITNTKWSDKQKTFHRMYRPFLRCVCLNRATKQMVSILLSPLGTFVFISYFFHFTICCCCFSLGLMNITIFRLLTHFHCTTSVNLRFIPFQLFFSPVLDISPFHVRVCVLCLTNFMRINKSDKRKMNEWSEKNILRATFFWLPQFFGVCVCACILLLVFFIRLFAWYTPFAIEPQ